MAKGVKVYGKVTEEGEMLLSNNRLFKQSVAELFKGKPIEVSVKEFRKVRSSKQLKYYFGVVLNMIAAELEETQGYKISKDDIDSDLRAAFLWSESVDIVTGEIKKRTKSLKEVDQQVNTLEMLLYIEAVRDWAAVNLFIEIPDPDPHYKERLEELKYKQNEKIN